MNIYDIYGNVLPLDGGGSSLFTNVKDFGAKGDGTTDDASAIQSALDSLSETGGIIYFPYGIYMITEPVLFYSNQTLFFEPGATILMGAELDSLMRNKSTTDITGYNGTHDAKIIGATFDGANYTVNATPLAFCHASDIEVKNCTFKNIYGNYHNIEINSSQFVLVENCIFTDARKTGTNAEDIQIDGAIALAAYPWGDINIDGTPCQYVEIKGCRFMNNSRGPCVGNHSDAAHKYVRIHDNDFIGNTSGRGAVNFMYCLSADVYNNNFKGCTKCFDSSDENGSHTFHDNRVDGATTVTGNYITAYNNIVSGTVVE